MWAIAIKIFASLASLTTKKQSKFLRKTGEWVYATISPGSSYSLKMDSISGYQSGLKTLLEKQRKFFPDLKMIGNESIILVDGKWISGSILHPLPHMIKSYSEFLDKLDELQVTVKDGIPYFGPPTTDCEKAFRDFQLSMTSAMARLCAMPDGHSIGYCNGSKRCAEISNLRPANDCGGTHCSRKIRQNFPRSRRTVVDDVGIRGDTGQGA